jgi:hypothetical protein
MTRMMRMSVAFGAALAGLAPLAASGGPQPSASASGDVAAFYRGPCRLTVNGEDRACHSVVYMHFRETGRVSFTVGLGEGLVTFSGDNDRQPRSDHYELDVNRFYDTQSSRQTDPARATGLCAANITADGRVMRSLTCDAQSALGAAHLQFASDGSPPEIVADPAGRAPR